MTYLYNDDCFNVLKQIPNNSIDLVVTDPPYKITSISGGGTVNDIKHLNKSLKQLDDIGMTKGYDIEACGKELLRVLKEPNIYIWCNKAQIVDYLRFYAIEHKCKFEILVWLKQNALPTYSNKYLSDKEYCLYFFKGKGKTFPANYEDAKTYKVGYINHADKKLYNHPSIKPLDFTEKMIRNSSREGQTVLDPFMGSGTVGVACKNLKRNFIGIEMNDEYFITAIKRIEGENINAE